MKLRDNQTFLSLYYEPNAVEVATGEADSFASAESWQRTSPPAPLPIGCGEGSKRKHLGQVATPERIAVLMSKWVMSAKPRTLLDPAAGLGGLLAACRRLDGRVQLVGVERDTETLQRAKTTAPRGTKLVLADYLRSDAGQFDGIIANPPYVKAHRLDYSEKDWRYFEERLGTPLDRLTNLYALFLLKIWEDLAPRGRAAVILPAEFLNANFGEEIKERLVRVIRPAALAVFTPSVNLFADALTTSAIVFLDKARSPKALSWAKRVESVEEAEGFVGRLLAGTAVRAGRGCIDLTTLNPHDKWLNLLLNETAPTDSPPLRKRVGDYFDCRRGIATGANDFFCLSRADLREHHLAEAHVEACITKAVDADGLVFTREKFGALVAAGRRCFLLNPSRNGQDLMRYLKLGEQRGIPQRHLPSHRPVWYLPENRAVADIWVAVFSRESVKFILNSSGAKNLTCFHGLYAKSGSETLPPLMTLFLNSSGGRRAFSRVNRFYGDGLNKLEPKDVEDMPCPTMAKLSRAEANELTRKLAELEKLPASERLAHIDQLAARFLDPITQPEEPSSSQPRRVQSRRPAGQHTHRAAPVP
ncbi:MAG: SAM-dependent DNA methyltransferase [Verrucomicrobia bacterium]|nr:SAM-dependent DNA methyltransferase [Verrucomicrobiota bacterium]